MLCICCDWLELSEFTLLGAVSLVNTCAGEIQARRVPILITFSLVASVLNTRQQAICVVGTMTMRATHNLLLLLLIKGSTRQTLFIYFTGIMTGKSASVRGGIVTV